MNWKYTKDIIPLGWESVEWDGCRSDEIIAEDVKGKKYIAIVYSGNMDGCRFDEWYDNNDYLIENIVRWMPIPE